MKVGQNKGGGRQKNFKDNASSSGKKPRQRNEKKIYIFHQQNIFQNKLPE